MLLNSVTNEANDLISRDSSRSVGLHKGLQVASAVRNLHNE